MDDKRICLCEHDLLWHGVGIGSNACKARTLKDAADMFGWPCHCQGFRRVVPGETTPEPDLMQMLWRLDLAITRLADMVAERFPEPEKEPADG